MVLVSVTFPGAVIKYPYKSHLKGGGVYLLLKGAFQSWWGSLGDSNPRQLVALHRESGSGEW